MNTLSSIKYASIAAVFVPFLAQAEEVSANLQKEQIQHAVEERLASMEKRIKLLGITPRLTVENQQEEDNIAELARSGAMIDCTLEEVEAALAAAAATSDTEDDIKAMRMLHWGSYRFFLDNEKVK